MDDRLPPFLLKALFSLATLFLQLSADDPTNDSVEPSELATLSRYQRRGRPWAETATKEVLLLAVLEPSLVVLQSVLSLMMYWFSLGDKRAAEMMFSIAYRCSDLLGFNRLTEARLRDQTFTLEAELARRSFWYSWFTLCIAGAPKAYLRNAWLEVEQLPLPCALTRISSGVLVTPNETMDAEWHSHRCDRSTDEDSSGRSIFAGVAKILGIWARVQVVAMDLIAEGVAERCEVIDTLADLADSIYQAPDSPARGRTSVLIDQSERLDDIVMFESLYHLCQMILHSIIVPRFSGIPLDPSVPNEYVQYRAETVVYHASMVAKMFDRHLAGRADVSTIPPVVGYAIFVAGSALLIFMSSKPRTETLHLRGEDYDLSGREAQVETLLLVLGILQQYWKILDGPLEKLQHAATAHKAKMHQNMMTPGETPHPHIGEDNALNKATPGDSSLPVVGPGYVHPAHDEAESTRDSILLSFTSRREVQNSCSGPSDLRSMRRKGRKGHLQEQATTTVLTETEGDGMVSVDTRQFAESFDDFPDDWWNLPSPFPIESENFDRLGIFDNMTYF
ncbi:hypothetical protein NA57DRAFT_56118 [Rhizodiscina lignyota]|uniref:Xylanolytic transcriptional activator regulatory domain-containing protein n=1 Tax=Rhizodiscina lignyota TaxID=1504668 RepID=A0A9P4IH97_9PEZI|nr:hypothetical protein NA57DRAFT_56118 [Rhizodiscina lignyota]